MSPKEPQPFNTEFMIAELARGWYTNVAKLKELVTQIALLKQAQDMILDQIDKSTRLLHDIRDEYPKIKAPILVLPLELRFVANPNLTIGDAIEMLLIEHGPMMQREIIDALKKSGMRMSSKNPHVVVANAVKRDAKNRFKRLNDGRVALEKGRF